MRIFERLTQLTGKEDGRNTFIDNGLPNLYCQASLAISIGRGDQNFHSFRPKCLAHLDDGLARSAISWRNTGDNVENLHHNSQRSERQRSEVRAESMEQGARSKANIRGQKNISDCELRICRLLDSDRQSLARSRPTSAPCSKFPALYPLRQ